MGVPEKTLGKVRYFTYYLHFPKDREVWQDQVPFIHDLRFTLDQSRWRHNKEICTSLLKKGEAQWKDDNGMLHRVVIEDIERPRRWGIKR